MRSQTRAAGIVVALGRLQAAGWSTAAGHSGRHQFWVASRGAETRLLTVRTTAHRGGRLFTRHDPERLVPALMKAAGTMGSDPWVVGVDVPVALVKWEPAGEFAAHIRRLRWQYLQADPIHRTADGLVLGRKVANMRVTI